MPACALLWPSSRRTTAPTGDGRFTVFHLMISIQIHQPTFSFSFLIFFNMPVNECMSNPVKTTTSIWSVEAALARMNTGTHHIPAETHVWRNAFTAATTHPIAQFRLPTPTIISTCLWTCRSTCIKLFVSTWTRTWKYPSSHRSHQTQKGEIRLTPELAMWQIEHDHSDE